MPRAIVSENFKKRTIFIKQKMHSMTISKVRKKFFLLFHDWQKSIFATKKRFKIMKKMPKKPFYTNKNHEKCNFLTKKDQIFGLKLCTLFFICSRS